MLPTTVLDDRAIARRLHIRQMRSALHLQENDSTCIDVHSVLDFAGVTQFHPFVIRCSVVDTNNSDLPLSEMFERHLFSLQTMIGGPLRTLKDD